MATERRDPIASSVWGREATKSRERTDPGLTREQIVRAAVELLDAEGPGGLSMRKLATRLGSGTTSAYWHVANKDELLDLALDAVLGEVPLPTEHPDDWRGELADYVRGIRATMLAHPWIPAVIGHRPNAGPNALQLSERLLVTLESVGFDLVDAARASSALTAYAVGNALSEVAWRGAVQRSGMTADELTAVYSNHYEQESSATPVFARWWEAVAPLDLEAERERSFEYGLRSLVEGMATPDLGPPARSPRPR